MMGIKTYDELYKSSILNVEIAFNLLLLMFVWDIFDLLKISLKVNSIIFMCSIGDLRIGDLRHY